MSGRSMNDRWLATMLWKTSVDMDINSNNELLMVDACDRLCQEDFLPGQEEISTVGCD